ncbi:MAG: methionine ABC transporter ATP-binding protein [Candidatus Izemoplasmatales bacterium]|nr:methionine ABC transporter ATP-binding protein [Candidatus Izemoplasmatales bacterium]MDY0138648.1 methionine ABC transporter ATP-binding protein [Candidatus Izemoplasmatales bacterium]
MISLKNISKKYKNSGDEIALKNVSIDFKKGLIHGIIGISGAGKSTLIRLINTLETYDEGNLSVFEYTDLKKLNKESTRMLRKRIGMIFQTDHLLSRKTVLENVLLPISIQRKHTLEDINYAKDLLNEVGLKDYHNRYPSQLSGGQRQRVGIARALINRPELLICDEPTSALDVITTAQILSLIKTISKEHHIDVLIVTHDMLVIKEICDTVTVMQNGEIVESGILDDILFKAKHPQTQAFVREVGLDLSYIRKLYNSKDLLLLKFDESLVQENIIADMINILNIDISIIYANITPHRKGIMVIQAEDKQKEIIDFLKDKKVVIDYVV